MVKDIIVIKVKEIFGKTLFFLLVLFLNASTDTTTLVSANFNYSHVTIDVWCNISNCY